MAYHLGALAEVLLTSFFLMLPYFRFLLSNTLSLQSPVFFLRPARQELVLEILYSIPARGTIPSRALTFITMIERLT